MTDVTLERAEEKPGFNRIFMLPTANFFFPKSQNLFLQVRKDVLMKNNLSGEKILPLGVPKMGRFCWILCVPMMSHHRNWSREGRKMPKNYQVFYVIPLVSFEGDVQKISSRSDYYKCVKNSDKYTMPVGPFLNLTSLISHLRNKKQS